jgi:hypothetical protein
MLRKLYLVNAALLTVHEIDSAYWREWDLFHLPGGPSAFLALHVALVLLVIWGYGQVLSGSRAGLWMSVALACAGILALLLHGLFLLQGRPEFRTAASLTVLAGTGLVSFVQATVAVGTWRRRIPPSPLP